MTTDDARMILEDMHDAPCADGSLWSFREEPDADAVWVHWLPAEPYISLWGHPFTVEQLEAVVVWVKAHQEA